MSSLRLLNLTRGISLVKWEATRKWNTSTFNHLMVLSFFSMKEKKDRTIAGFQLGIILHSNHAFWYLALSRFAGGSHLGVENYHFLLNNSLQERICALRDEAEWNFLAVSRFLVNLFLPILKRFILKKVVICLEFRIGSPGCVLNCL